jgi:hypothetical protein|tara:strand:- start:588 stop:1070 length:483 start_codon:yes stop_codon:yes gene_type:complete
MTWLNKALNYKFGLDDLLVTGGAATVLTNFDRINNMASGLENTLYSSSLSSVGSSVGTALSTTADAAIGLHNLYYGLAASTYNLVAPTVASLVNTSSIATGLALPSAALGITLGFASGVALYVGLGYLTFKVGRSVGKKALKATSYLIKAPFKGLKKLLT